MCLGVNSNSHRNWAQTQLNYEVRKGKQGFLRPHFALLYTREIFQKCTSDQLVSSLTPVTSYCVRNKIKAPHHDLQSLAWTDPILSHLHPFSAIPSCLSLSQALCIGHALYKWYASLWSSHTWAPCHQNLAQMLAHPKVFTNHTTECCSHFCIPAPILSTIAFHSVSQNLVLFPSKLSLPPSETISRRTKTFSVLFQLTLAHSWPLKMFWTNEFQVHVKDWG